MGERKTRLEGLWKRVKITKKNIKEHRKELLNWLDKRGDKYFAKKKKGGK